MSSLVVRRVDYLATTDRATLIELLDGYTRNPLRGGVLTQRKLHRSGC